MGVGECYGLCGSGLLNKRVVDARNTVGGRVGIEVVECVTKIVC